MNSSLLIKEVFIKKTTKGRNFIGIVILIIVLLTGITILFANFSVPNTFQASTHLFK